MNELLFFLFDVFILYTIRACMCCNGVLIGVSHLRQLTLSFRKRLVDWRLSDDAIDRESTNNRQL